jgi:hypothetical protein
MKEAGLSFRDYTTQCSANALLNACRRFIDTTASKIREAGLDEIDNAVVGSAEYGDDAPRLEMLDRYNTHTVNCLVYLTSLRQTRARETGVKVLQTALQGDASGPDSGPDEICDRLVGPWTNSHRGRYGGCHMPRFHCGGSC